MRRKRRKKNAKATTLNGFLKSIEREAKATFNIATGYLSVEFPAKPSTEILSGLKTRGFRWKPRGKRWSAKWSVYREDFAKTLVGKIAKIDITPDWMRKAEYAKELSLKHGKEATERFDRTWKSMKTIPLGQPILVGHHSEKAHRAHLRRIDKGFEIARRERGLAEKYGERAKRYKRKARGEPPGLIYRRLKKMEAKERMLLREMDTLKLVKKLGEEKAKRLGLYAPSEDWVTRNLKHVQERLKIERRAYKANGGIPAERMKLKKGQWVQTTYGLAKIVKVNPKTVTIRRQGSTWNLKIDKSQILGKAKL